MEFKDIMKDGLSFRKIFVEIIVLAISVFLGFRWQSFIAEMITEYFPVGTGLGEKFGINVALTFFLVYVAYMLMNAEKESIGKILKKNMRRMKFESVGE